MKVIADWPDVALPPLGIDRYTAFVALTHDPKIDDPALTHALARDCFYIGALGSKKTHARRLERLKAQGISEAALARIHSPIGLDIGAVSPAEIAVAIIGEITARLRLARRGAAHEVRPGAACAGRGRGRGPFHPQGRPGAEERHRDRRGRDRRARAAGVAEIVVARLEPGDVPEDVAAAEIAAAVAGEGARIDRAFTGRANLFAEIAGVLVVDKAAIDRLNVVDESITFATLPAYKPVVAGEMIATVKIIPFAVASRRATARSRSPARRR